METKTGVYAGPLLHAGHAADAAHHVHARLPPLDEHRSADALRTRGAAAPSPASFRLKPSNQRALAGPTSLVLGGAVVANHRLPSPLMVATPLAFACLTAFQYRAWDNFQVFVKAREALLSCRRRGVGLDYQPGDRHCIAVDGDVVRTLLPLVTALFSSCWIVADFDDGSGPEPSSKSATIQHELNRAEIRGRSVRATSLSTAMQWRSPGC